LVTGGSRGIGRAVASVLVREGARVAICSRSAPALESAAREIEVLRLVAKGRTNAEIAEELRITRGTAKWFVSSILSKLGVDDRTEAVTMALERGILH